jgi:hypothetical protein
MKAAPEFAAYPLASPPVYARWLAAGVVLLALVSSLSVLLKPFTKPEQAAAAVAIVTVLWGMALMLRTLRYRFNRHNAQCYEDTANYVRQRWWRHHRQTVALVESVLVGPVCSTPLQAPELFSSDHQPPDPAETSEGMALRMISVLGDNPAERELHLARLLALQWREQCDGDQPLKPVQCYWQGSLSAWQVFIEEVNSVFPQVELPEQPEPWQGMRSLDAIVDRLQGVPANVHILCGGCQSTPAQPESRLPAGEAALLWLLSSQGGVRFCRGEWYEADTDDLVGVAARTLQQSQSVIEQKLAVSFSQPDMPAQADTDWNFKPLLQDANFGELGDLQAMVVQTLAAWYAQHKDAPCLWLTKDPHHTLALGVVEADESAS